MSVPVGVGVYGDNTRDRYPSGVTSAKGSSLSHSEECPLFIENSAARAKIDMGDSRAIAAGLVSIPDEAIIIGPPGDVHAESEESLFGFFGVGGIFSSQKKSVGPVRVGVAKEKFVGLVGMDPVLPRVVRNPGGVVKQDV